MTEREGTQTLMDRRQEDRRGKGKAMGLHEFLWLSVNADRRQEDRRKP